MSQHRSSPRPSMRRAGAALVVAALVSVVAACGDTDTGSPSTAGEAAAETPTWLFSVTGSSAQITSATADGSAELVLADPADVVAFTDRPERRAVRFPAETLVTDWPSLFASSPPNAVVTGLDPDGEQFETAVEIASLQSAQGGSLGFALRPIGDDEVALPAELSEVALFIDDVDCDSPQETSVCLVFTSTFVPFDSSF
jgi:hypothetical protein